MPMAKVRIDRQRALTVVAGLVAILAVTSGFVLAQGFGWPREGGHGMWLLARAAGLNHSQIVSAFTSDSNLATDRANLKSAHDALMSCLVSTTVTSSGCTSQITAFSNALQAMAQERMSVWQNLFKTAPNLSQASTVYSQLKQLRSERQQILQSVFGSSGSQSGSETGPK
jgi:hypothetical protein